MSATEETTPKFVYYTCRRPKVRKFAIKRMTGTSGRQRVPKDVFDNLEIELPPLSQQKKIADILGSLDDKIETNNRINQLLEEIAQAIFKSWFVDFEPYEEFKDSELGEIPEEFEVVPFQDIAEIEMGSSPKSEYYNEDGEGLPFFQGSKNFGMRYPKIERWCSEPKKIGEEDDVIMSVRAPVGDLNRLMEKSCVGRGVAAFRMRSTTNEFLFYLLDAYQDKWDKYASGTTYESVNSDDVANFPVIKPPEDKIREFNDLVRPMEQIIKQNTRERDKLSNARDTLLPKLMSGEIRVSDDGVE